MVALPGRFFTFMEMLPNVSFMIKGIKKSVFVSPNSHNFINSRESHPLKAYFWKDLEQISPVWFLPKDLGVGVDFQTCSEGDFFTRCPQSVASSNKKVEQILGLKMDSGNKNFRISLRKVSKYNSFYCSDFSGQPPWLPMARFHFEGGV